MTLMTKALRVLLVATTALPLLMAAPGGLSNFGVSAAFAETKTLKVNAPTLLANIKRGLGAVLVGYKGSSEGKTKANGLVIKSAGAAAVEVAKLEKALKAKKSKDISRATQSLSVAIGKLQSTYKLARVQDATVAEGMRSVSSNWAAYSARYGLAKADKRAKKASAKQVAGLKKRVGAMDKRLSGLSSQAAKDARLARDLAALLSLMAAIRAQDISDANYQEMLFRLSVLNGWYLGYAGFSEYYYPDYYYYFEDGYSDFASYDAYWDGYYDGYYASWPSDYYDRDFAYPDLVDLYVDNSVYEQTNIYVDNSVTVFNTEVAAEAASYEEFAAAPEDLPEAEAAMAMDSAAAEAAAFATYAQPVPEELSEIEAAEAPIDDTAYADELATESDALIADDTAVTDETVTDETVTDDAASMEATIADEAFVEEPTDAQADEDPAPEEQTYEEPALEEQAYDEPALEEQTYEEPAPEEQAYEEPAPEEQTYEEPAPEEQTYEEPAPEEQTYEEPAPEEQTYEEPAPEEQTYEEPAPEEQTYEEPAPQEPVYEEPAYQEPAYEEPAYQEPAYEEPAPQQECSEEFPCEY